MLECVVTGSEDFVVCIGYTWGLLEDSRSFNLQLKILKNYSETYNTFSQFLDRKYYLLVFEFHLACSKFHKSCEQ